LDKVLEIQGINVLDFDLLRRRLVGCVVSEGDPNYDDARSVWNAVVDRRPAAIVRCASTADVLEALRFATASNRKVTVRGGGHSVEGRPIQHDALVIDLSGMRTVHVDAARRRAIVAGGATWRDVDTAAGAFWLGTTGGMVSTTGVGGLTLGGGIGWLMRKFGLAADNVLAAEVALANGELLNVDEHHHQDLFEAIQGGTSIPGVVTAFTFRLHTVGTVFAGELWFPVEQAGNLLRTLRPLLADAPDELTVMVSAMATPTVPSLPAAMHGKPAVALGVCWCGDLEAGASNLADIRALKGAFADHIAARSYVGFQSSLDATAPHGMRHSWRTLSMRTLEDPVVDLFARRAMDLPTSLSLVHIHQLGGKVARGRSEPPSAVLRDHEFILKIVGTSAFPQDDARVNAWVHEFATELEPYAGPQTYVNFEGRVEHALDATTSGAIQARLASLRARYDPAGVFLWPR